MSRNRYNITYGAPLAVKDQPHRALETARDAYALPERDELANVPTTVIRDLDPTDAAVIVETEVVELVAD